MIFRRSHASQQFDHSYRGRYAVKLVEIVSARVGAKPLENSRIAG